MTRSLLMLFLLSACPGQDSPLTITQSQRIDGLTAEVKALTDQEVIMVSRLDMIAIALDNCRRDR